ncbi:IPTL-CTERM sorting domain-containing protein [Ottowia thiooxydans]
MCALAAIAQFDVIATCTGVDPVVVTPPVAATPTAVPTLDVAGLGLLGLLSAGVGALALRRRNRSAR